MIEQDTVKLLRECDAGVKMGVTSIEDVLPHIKSEKFKKYLEKCKFDEYNDSTSNKTLIQSNHLMCQTRYSKKRIRISRQSVKEFST
mgnify:CR=1 FL=1